MEILLRCGKNQLTIDSQVGDVNFCVITEDGKQMDFAVVEAGDWDRLKDFIDDQIEEYLREQKKED
jgi:hypothetical protein